jgi:hypothetical protein
MQRPVRKSIKAMAFPKIDQKIMKHSYQRAGVVAGGTLLSSGAWQVTVAFPADLTHILRLAAMKKKLSLSEMVRQCVRIALETKD